MNNGEIDKAGNVGQGEVIRVTNECLEGNGFCDGTCVDTPGSYHCTCPRGQELYRYNGQNDLVLPASETGLEPYHQYHINHSSFPMVWR